MSFSSKIFREFRLDHRELIYELKLLRNTSIPLRLRRVALKKICPKLIQSCHFEERILYEFMRSRQEDEFHLMVLVGVQDHLDICKLIKEVEGEKLSQVLWIDKTHQLMDLLEKHFSLVEDEMFLCIGYYLSNEMDGILYDRYLSELNVQ